MTLLFFLTSLCIMRNYSFMELGVYVDSSGAPNQRPLCLQSYGWALKMKHVYEEKNILT